MVNTEDHVNANANANATQEKPVESPVHDVPSGDVENPSVVSSIVKRWEREDLLKKASLILRTATLVFTFLSFIIMASNNHGDWKDFNKYQEYRYCLVIAILAMLYTGAQVLRQIKQITTGNYMVSRRRDSFIDFFGDQIMAYMLMSAASAAIPLTDRMREGTDNIFTDSSAASISMAFFAFVTLALSAMVSGFQLSTQNLF